MMTTYEYKSHDEINKLPRPLADIKYLVFSGRRDDLSDSQKIMVVNFIRLIKFKCAFHGDCIGADGQFHDLVRENRKKAWIEVYPSPYEAMRAFKEGDLTHEAMKAAERDKYMINQGEILLAAPPTKQPVKSGTWANISFAETCETIQKIIVIAPDGQFCVRERLDKTGKF
jgi:hypothetical protein